jgi:Ran GTPase-activating protein (RanGAP) involved in mRNA processing and transport
MATKLEGRLEDIANGADHVLFESSLDVESVCRLMGACTEANSKVMMLDLIECGLGDEAVQVIASSLRSNRVLTELNLDDNDIGPRGAQALSDTRGKKCVGVMKNMPFDWWGYLAPQRIAKGSWRFSGQ